MSRMVIGRRDNARPDASANLHGESEWSNVKRQTVGVAIDTSIFARDMVLLENLSARGRDAICARPVRPRHIRECGH